MPTYMIVDDLDTSIGGKGGNRDEGRLEGDHEALDAKNSGGSFLKYQNDLFRYWALARAHQSKIKWYRYE